MRSDAAQVKMNAAARSWKLHYKTALAPRRTRTLGQPDRQGITLHTPGGIAFPQAEQAIRITRARTITTSGKTTRETAYLTISLPPLMPTRSTWARRTSRWATAGDGFGPSG